VPLIPEGNLIKSGSSWPVILSLPDLTDQQSSTGGMSVKNVKIEAGNYCSRIHSLHP